MELGRTLSWLLETLRCERWARAEKMSGRLLISFTARERTVEHVNVNPKTQTTTYLAGT